MCISAHCCSLTKNIYQNKKIHKRKKSAFMSFNTKRWSQAFEMIKETNGALDNYDGMCLCLNLYI